MVTGASGLLGSAILPAIDKEWDVFPFGGTRVPEHVSGDRCDMTELADVARAVTQVEPDVLLHLAALADVDACQADPNRAYLSNVVTAVNVATVCAERRRPPKVILVSTDQVYDAPGANVVANPRPTNVYALTKLWSESVGRQNLENAIALRVNFVCVGDDVRPGFGGWLLKALTAGSPLNLFHDVFFNPLHASHLSELITAIANTPGGGVYNVGARDTGMSKAAFGIELCRRAGLDVGNIKEISVGNANLKAYRPRGMVMDVHETEAFLGVMLPTMDQCIDALHQEWIDSSEGRIS